MLVSIISDIHDNVWNLKAALKKSNQAETLICCGDLCSPFTAALLAEGFPGEIHIVFGNNDGDQHRITNVANGFGDRVNLHGEFAEIILGGMRFAVNHYPAIAGSAAESGKYDVVCYGHDHTYGINRIGDAVMINPGAVMGYDGVSKSDIPSTFVLFDTDSGGWTGYEVETSDSGKAAVEFKARN